MINVGPAALHIRNSLICLPTNLIAIVGVHSPTLSGLSQADAYRPFRIPTILIADSRLGGISTSLASYESLLIRGYTIDAVLLFRDEYYRNHDYLAEHFAKEKDLMVHVVDPPPVRNVEDKSQDERNMEEYYASLCDPSGSNDVIDFSASMHGLAVPPSSSVSSLTSKRASTPMAPVLSHLRAKHEQRISNIASMPARTLASVWWPFVQHKNVSAQNGITVIDSAYGDFFEAIGPGSPSPAGLVNSSSITSESPASTLPAQTPAPILTQQFDGSASWWTQCLGHAHPELTLAAAHAAGRYGHVIFPLATNEPALLLAERLIADGSPNIGPGSGWANKVFFSDDGSTGTEVALKMAMRASALRYPSRSSSSINGLPDTNPNATVTIDNTVTILPSTSFTNLATSPDATPIPNTKRELHILGIAGSYHGDTIGAMDACEGGVYNSAVEWHRERGFWFDPPKVGVREGGVVSVSIPASWGIEAADLVNSGVGSDGTGRVVRRDADGTIRVLYGLPGSIATASSGSSPSGSEGALSPIRDLQALYDVPSRLAHHDPLEAVYRDHVTAILERLILKEGRTFGALILEPILMGAGGMIWVDPLFQRVLIDVVREREDLWSNMSHGMINTVEIPPGSSISQSVSSWRGLPVIFDEVFVGLYRLGFLSSSSILGTTPDISVLAKILTGGLVPMSVTLASDAIYNAFWADEKKDALLHGHSYTAHPIGCAVAVKTLDIISQVNAGQGEAGQEWAKAKGRWDALASLISPGSTDFNAPAAGASERGTGAGVWSLWDPDFISTASRHRLVDEVMCMGTVLAIQLADDAAAGSFGLSSCPPFSFRSMVEFSFLLLLFFILPIAECLILILIDPP